MCNRNTLQRAPVPPLQAQPTAGRDLKAEPVFAMRSIQSDLLLGHAKKAEALVFFEITYPEAFKAFLGRVPITSAADVYRPVGEATAIATGYPPPNPRYGVGFTFEGLKAIGADGVDALERHEVTAPLVEGLAARAVQQLNDADPGGWLVGGAARPVHGVFVVTGAETGDVDAALRQYFQPGANDGLRVVEILRGETRPGDFEGHEHFGFLDGVSQPGIRGCVDPEQTTPLTPNSDPGNPDQGLPGQDLLWPGEFVFGYPAQKRDAAEFTEKGPPRDMPQPWMRDGAFLVVRRLIQKVPEMHVGTQAAAEEQGLDAGKLESQLVGRWPSGAPILQSPDGDKPELGQNPQTNNDFEFKDDREGRICPWAAHIRKTYPRDDVRGNISPDGGEVDKAEASTQTHRMLRRGIQFGPELTDEERDEQRTQEQRGLLFKCYVTDIAAQFEFVQRSWCNNPDFVQPGAGIDAIIGQAPGGANRPFLGAGPQGQKPEFSFRPWVEMTGGGYFFAPSLDFLARICTPAA